MKEPSFVPARPFQTGQGKSMYTFSAKHTTFSAFRWGGYAMQPCGHDSREGGQCDTGVGRSSSIEPNSSMQYKYPQEPPYLWNRKSAGICGKRIRWFTWTDPFETSLMLVRKAGSFQVLPSGVGSWPYPQTLD
jgi:hypothetical protein